MYVCVCCTYIHEGAPEKVWAIYGVRRRRNGGKAFPNFSIIIDRIAVASLEYTLDGIKCWCVYIRIKNVWGDTGNERKGAKRHKAEWCRYKKRFF